MRRVATGRYGAVFEAGGDWPASLDLAMRDELPAAVCTAREPGPYAARADARIAIKLQHVAGAGAERDAIQEERCMSLCGARSFAPVLLGGCTIRPRPPSSATPEAVRATFMTLVLQPGNDRPAPTLWQQRHRMPRAEAHDALYPHVERAVTEAWRAGVAHCDLHEENVLVVGDGRGGWAAVLVDFGFAIIVPPRRRWRLAHALELGADPADAFDDVVRPFVVRELQSRGVAGPNLDGAFLRDVRDSLLGPRAH